MKKESFDTPWFLREAEPQDIQALAKRVGNLPADVSDRIISKIQSALVLARKQATAKDKDPKGKSGEMNRFKRTSGALSKVLEILSVNKISMTKIESIPTKERNWEYLFLIDISGHIHDKKISIALKKIESTSKYFQLLGSYPKSID